MATYEWSEVTLLDASALDEVGAAVAHVGDRHLVVAETGGGQGGGHAAVGSLGHTAVVDCQVGGVEHLPEELLGRYVGLGPLECGQGRLNGQLAGHLSLALAPHAVREDHQRTVGPREILARGRPEPYEVLVV